MPIYFPDLGRRGLGKGQTKIILYSYSFLYSINPALFAGSWTLLLILDGNSEIGAHVREAAKKFLH